MTQKTRESTLIKTFMKLTYIFFIDISIVVRVNNLKSTLHQNGSSVVKPHPLNKYLVPKMKSPYFSVEVDCALGEGIQSGRRINWGFLCQQRSVERINWQKCLTKFTISKQTISVFIESLHEDRELLVAWIYVETLQSSPNVNNTNGALASWVQHSKRINQVEVAFETQLHFLSFKFFLQLNHPIQDLKKLLIIRNDNSALNMLVSFTSIESRHIPFIPGKIIINSLAYSCDVHHGLHSSTYHFDLVVRLTLFGRVDMAHRLIGLIVLVKFVIELDLGTASRANLFLRFTALKD